MFKCNSLGVTRWDGNVVVCDLIGNVVTLKASVQMMPKRLGQRLVTWSAEGLKGEYVTVLDEWCEQAHQELTNAITYEYKGDVIAEEADVHNICLLFKTTEADCNKCSLRHSKYCKGMSSD